MHFRFVSTRLVFQTTYCKGPRLFLMADATSMLPKWDRANVKLLDIINSANSKFTFFRNGKAGEKRQ